MGRMHNLILRYRRVDLGLNCSVSSRDFCSTPTGSSPPRNHRERLPDADPILCSKDLSFACIFGSNVTAHWARDPTQYNVAERNRLQGTAIMFTRLSWFFK